MEKILPLKCLLLTLLATFALAPRFAAGQNVLASWDFTGKGGQSSVPATATASGVSGTAAIGSGLIPVGDLSNGLNARNQTKTSLTEAVAANHYISFTVTPEAGKIVTITGIKLRPVSQNRERSFALFASQKNQLGRFTASGLQQPLREIKTTASYMIPVNKIMIAGSRRLSPVTDMVEFRLYIYGDTNESEVVGIGERPSGLNEPDLLILGSVSSGTVPDIDPPSAPTNLSAASVTSAGFRLNWTASTDNVGVASYEVFADGTSKGSTSSLFMNVSGLNPSTTYSMTVKAKDAAGNVSAASTALPVTTAATGTYPNSNSRMGINLSGVNDYSDEQPFKDVFKTARPWNLYENPGQLSLDANGWVTSLNGAAQARAYVMISDNPDKVYELGQYVLLYEGTGTISFSGPGVSLVSSAPGRMVYNVSSLPPLTDDVYVRQIDITSTGSGGNHIRNIRLLPAIYESNYQENPWRPYILERWAKFKTIRFMDWMLTNNSTQVNWATRTTLPWYTYNDRSGIPVELLADLCNRLHADAWINVPHRANDDYVANMAALLRDTLNPDLKIYIEYSNECWNGQFEQAQYCEQNGTAAYPQITPFEAQLRWYSHRAVEVFNIFESVFGGTSRLVRTLGAQQANAWTAEVALENENALSKTDAVAIAPYFGHEYACEKYQQVKNGTLQQFFDDILATSLPTAWTNTTSSIDYIKSKGKLAVAYEGGQHLTGIEEWACDGVNTKEDTALNQKFLDANIFPEMGNIYRADLNKWKELGGDIYCAFSAVGNYSKHGYWGILRYPKQNPADAPKYQAIMQWIDSNPQ